MSERKLHIAILEPSEIIYEGIVNILLSSTHNIHIFRIDSIHEISNSNEQEPTDIVICNPLVISSNFSEFTEIKEKFGALIWIAISYSFSEQKLLQAFNDIIEITDKPETIIQKIENFNTNMLLHSKQKQQDVLSEREIQVLEQLVKGLSNKEIADVLHISTHTVISHRKNITQKTGIKSQSGLTIYAISNKIIQL